MNPTNRQDQPDQDTHSHGPGRRRRHSHRKMTKLELAEHWVKKHLWKKYWAYIIAIILGLLVAKYCVPVDF